MFYLYWLIFLKNYKIFLLCVIIVKGERLYILVVVCDDVVIYVYVIVNKIIICNYWLFRMVKSFIFRVIILILLIYVIILLYLFLRLIVF